MIIPLAMAQELGKQHRDDLLATSARWHNARPSLLARFRSRRRAHAEEAAPTAAPMTVAQRVPRGSGESTDVRGPLVRS